MDAQTLIDLFKNGPCVTLHVACNDGDSGRFTGLAEAVEVAYGGFDDRLQFSPNFFGWSPRFTVDWERKTLRIGGSFVIPYTSHGAHVGNWCWDCFKIRREDAARLIAWEKFRKWFNLDEGPVEIFEAYRAPNTSIHIPKRVGDAWADT